MIWYKKDLRRFKFLVALLVIATIMLICFMVSTAFRYEEPDPLPEQVLATVEDSPGSIFRLMEATCPGCGVDTYAMNGSFICRNEDCDRYGQIQDI